MDTTRALDDIFGFLKASGKLAREAQETAGAHLKADASLVTETDLAISRLAHIHLAPWLAQPGHILLDEESIEGVGTPEEVFATTEYQWVLDPIDGTAGYALGRSRYGISLGLLHKGAPLIGAIYIPAEHRLFVATPTEAYREDCAFTPEASRVPLASKPFTLNNQVFVETYFAAGQGWNDTFSSRRIWPSSPDSAVEGFTNALAGWAAGATIITGYSIWDVAAAAAMAKRAGFVVRSMRDGRLLERLDARYFTPQWKWAEPWLMCADANFDEIAATLQGFPTR